MANRELTVSRVVEASPEAVWTALTDVEHMPALLRGVSGVEVVAGEGYAVGTRWRETRRMLGHEETETMEVTGCEPPHRTVIESQRSGVRYRTEFTMQTQDRGTLLRACFGATHPDPTLLHRLTSATFGRVGEALTRRVLQQDLADIAAAVESSSDST